MWSWFLLLTGKSAQTSEHQCVTNTHKHTKLTCNKTERTTYQVIRATTDIKNDMVDEDKIKKPIFCVTFLSGFR